MSIKKKFRTWFSLEGVFKGLGQHQYFYSVLSKMCSWHCQPMIFFGWCVLLEVLMLPSLSRWWQRHENIQCLLVCFSSTKSQSTPGTDQFFDMIHPVTTRPQYWLIYSVCDDLWPLCVPTGHLFHKFGITESDWYRIKQSIDSKCRTAWRRKQRGQSLAVKSFSKRTPRGSSAGKVQMIVGACEACICMTIPF